MKFKQPLCLSLMILLVVATIGCGRGSQTSVVAPDPNAINNDAEMEAYNRSAAEGSAERK